MNESNKQFAKEIAEKVYERFAESGQYSLLSKIQEAIRQMVEHKLFKEGWEKPCLKK